MAMEYSGGHQERLPLLLNLILSFSNNSAPHHHTHIHTHKQKHIQHFEKPSRYSDQLLRNENWMKLSPQLTS